MSGKSPSQVARESEAKAKAASDAADAKSKSIDPTLPTDPNALREMVTDLAGKLDRTETALLTSQEEAAELAELRVKAAQMEDTLERQKKAEVSQFVEVIGHNSGEFVMKAIRYNSDSGRHPCFVQWFKGDEPHGAPAQLTAALFDMDGKFMLKM